MGTGHRYRRARERAAAALLTYVDAPTTDNERVFLAATRELEVLAMHSRRERPVLCKPRMRTGRVAAAS